MPRLRALDADDVAFRGAYVPGNLGTKKSGLASHLRSGLVTPIISDPTELHQKQLSGKVIRVRVLL